MMMNTFRVKISPACPSLMKTRIRISSSAAVAIVSLSSRHKNEGPLSLK
jgi:hypothetical protein